ncbi:MAG: hypothetical protein SGBAC_001685 [Bacillariaceae sp.]
MTNAAPKTTSKKGTSMIERLQRGSIQEEREKLNNHRSQYAVREKEVVPTNRIRLHVYDLIVESAVVPVFGVFELPVGQIFSALNSGLHTLGTGAYHVGVEVNGVEYAYGANEYEGITGVFTCAPMTAPGFQYRTTIDFGDRKPLFMGSRSTQDSRGILQGMAREYMGKEYDLLRKNCCTFAHDACVRLGIQDQEIPTWFRNLAEAGKNTQDAATSFTSLFEPSDEELMASSRRRLR